MEGSRLQLDSLIGDAISRIRFAPRSDNLLISSWDSLLRLYDVSGSVLRFEAFSEGSLLDCCFLDEAVALSASADGCVRRYCLCSGTQSIVGKCDDAINCLEFSDQTGEIIIATLSNELICWDIRSQRAVYKRKLDAEISSLSLCGLRLLIGVGSTTEVHDLRKLGTVVDAKHSSMDYQIKCLRTFSNCQGYGVGSVDGHVALKSFDPVQTSNMECVFNCHPKSRDRHNLVVVNDIAFHPCNNTFVTGDNEGCAIVWDAQTKKRLLEFQRYPASVASLSYSHSGHLLAVACCYTYQEANEVEDTPEIFIHEMM